MDSSLFFNYLKRNNESPQLSWEQHAQQLGIEVQQAFQFHNSYCDDANRCMSLSDVPTHYYSPKGMDLELLKRKYPKATLFRELAQLSPLAWHGTFRVLEHDDSISLKYQLKINILSEGQDFLIKYSTRDFFLNDEEEQGKMALVALKCMESIEPIQFRCGQNFKHLRLENHTELVEKWKARLPDLKEVFIDEFAAAYFEQFELNLTDSNYFFQRLTKQLPFQLFFGLPFSKENTTIHLNTLHSFISVEHQIKEVLHDDKYQFKTIKINGVKTDDRSYEHIYFNLDVPIAVGRPFRGKFSYELDVDPTTLSVQGLQFTNQTVVDQQEMNHSIIAYRIGND